MGKTFKDYITVTDGYQFSNKYFANSGKYILLTLANYNSNGGFKNNPYDCIYYDGYFPEKYILSKNDLLIAMTHERLLGSPIFIPESNKYLHRRMMGLIHCNEKLDKVYAYYLFNTRYVREQLIKLANGTIVKNLTVSLIYQTKVNIPDSIDYQKKVAQTLWNLDQKIELNQKINDNLEAQLQLLFNSYFLQFDFPNENNSPYSSSGGLMKWSNSLKKEIPLDWEVVNLKDICSLTWGQCPDGKNILDINVQGAYLLDYCSGAGDMKGGFIVDCQAKTDKSRRQAHKYDILVSVAGKIGDVCVVDRTISLGRAALACSANSYLETAFLYCTLKSQNKKLTTIATGSIQKVINNDHINTLNFAYSKQVVSDFGQIAMPIFEDLMKIAHENRKLAQLRDWLLPMLMNGQATIN